MQRIIKITQDGSPTIYDVDVDECFHSFYGAIQESRHVFINAGLDFLTKQSLNILEIGFGSGLNALLTLEYVKNKDKKIFYHSFEIKPLPMNIIENLNFSVFEDIELKTYFYQLHQSNWNNVVQINPNFYFIKTLSDFCNTQLLYNYDIVFFDAFSPNKQPELWNNEIFSKIFSALNENGILVTYCAKGIVQRILKSVGFEVEIIKGPPGKRHMIRAIKK